MDGTNRTCVGEKDEMYNVAMESSNIFNSCSEVRASTTGLDMAVRAMEGHRFLTSAKWTGTIHQGGWFQTSCKRSKKKWKSGEVRNLGILIAELLVQSVQIWFELLSVHVQVLLSKSVQTVSWTLRTLRQALLEESKDGLHVVWKPVVRICIPAHSSAYSCFSHEHPISQRQRGRKAFPIGRPINRWAWVGFAQCFVVFSLTPT